MTFLVALVIVFVLWPSAICKASQYKLNIVENGTSYTEVVEVDIKEQKEKYTVPAHNGQMETVVLNDFKLGVSITRFPSAKVCFMSDIDSDEPSPKELESGLQLASLVPASHDVATIPRDMMVTGVVERHSLTADVLEFCKNLPIYRLETFNMEKMEALMNASLGRHDGVESRAKRQLSLTQWSFCTPTGLSRVQNCMDGRQWKVECKYEYMQTRYKQVLYRSCHWYYKRVAYSVKTTTTTKCTFVVSARAYSCPIKASYTIKCCDYVCSK